MIKKVLFFTFLLTLTATSITLDSSIQLALKNDKRILLQEAQLQSSRSLIKESKAYMIFLLFLKSVIWTPQLRRLQPLLAIIRLGRRQLVTSLVSKDIFQQEHPITFLTSDLKRVKQILEQAQ